LQAVTWSQLLCRLLYKGTLLVVTAGPVPATQVVTSRCVPVWQNEQFSVQPTCEETHSVPRSVSGM